MTWRTEHTMPSELCEQIAEQGFDILLELIPTVINVAMRIEPQCYLGVEPYE